MNAETIAKTARGKVYAASVSQTGGGCFFLAKQGPQKLVGCVGGSLPESSTAGELDGKFVVTGPLSAANAAAVRQALPWTAPRCLGLVTSIGLGDRLGLATPGHIRAVRGSGFSPIFAQQSIREMTRTQRTPQQVIDAATWGVLQEGFRDGFGSDGDHIQNPEDLDAIIVAGFKMITIDPGKHVVNDAASLEESALRERVAKVDLATLATSLADLEHRYADRQLTLQGGSMLGMDRLTLMRTLVKYGNAVAHVARMARRIAELSRGDYEIEVSVDETESPTQPHEHYFVAAELKRLGVRWVSLAPRFIGRFEKGVDYIGDAAALAASLKQHVAVMRTLGPYKISIHSGSDKFSIYPAIAELTQGMVHLKTAGTNYLCALQAVAGSDPKLFREILQFAVSRYETDRASYHVSAEVAKIPSIAGTNGDLSALLDDFHARQVLHVTFGSVLTADGGERFATGIRRALLADEELHDRTLQQQIGRHLQPFVAARG